MNAPTHHPSAEPSDRFASGTGTMTHDGPYAAAGASTPPPPPPPGGDPRRGLGWRGFLVALSAGAIGAAGVAVPATLLDEDAPAPSESTAAIPDADVAEEFGSSTTAIARQVGPSVARVDVTVGNASGSGSAVVYREDGVLVTNAHVVDGARQVTVTLADGERVEAEVVGADPRSDLAVLRVDVEDLPVPQWAPEGASPQVGDPVLAIGSPFGLDGSVTSGIVSALGRTVPAGGAQVPLVDLLQTDAAINPGNSGGALVDAGGRIIGVNTAILSRTGANHGIGFAIPADAVRDVAEQLLEDGTVEHAELGVVGQTVDPDTAALYGLPVDEGAIVAEVAEGSPAEAAGLQRGDLIVSIDGDSVASVAELAARIRQHQPGETVEIELLRDDERRTVSVELGEATSDA